MASERIRRQKQGAALALVLLVGYFAVAIAVQFGMAVDKGYGTGFTNRGHVAASVAEPAGFEEGVDPVVMAEATNVTPPTDAWNEIWRVGGTFAVLLAIAYFYYLLMSRLGSF